MCEVQLRCTVTSPVSVGSATSGKSMPGWTRAGHTSARCEPAITLSCPEPGPAPVTEMPRVSAQHS